MNNNDFNEFSKILFASAEVYDKQLNKGAIKLYFEALKDIPLEQVSLALTSAIKTLKWFPKPSEIRELAFKKESISADEAWAIVKDLINECCGTGKTPVYPSHMIEQAVQSVGGLDYIWLAGIEQEGYIRNAFVKAYDGYAQREHNRQLIGHTEAKQILDKIQKQTEHR